MRTRDAAMAALIAATVGAAAQAGDGRVQAAAPDSLMAVLEEAGFAARLGLTRAGDPLIHATTPGELPFRIRFYGCRDGADCRSVQLMAGFAARGVALETVNGWNAAMRFGRVHVTPGGQPVLSYDLAFGPEGLPVAHVAEQFGLWERLMEGMLGLLDAE